MIDIDDLYARHIKPLPRDARLRLLAKVAEDLAEKTGSQNERGAQRSIMELHGLGKELWKGIDADKYVKRPA